MNTEAQTASIEIDADTETNPEIRILKTATCPSLSRKSNLTFNVGCNTVGEIQFQVIANDGGGYFNDDWVCLLYTSDAADE